MENCALYLNTNLSPEQRADNLLSVMTLEEKVGQMVQLDGRENIDKVIEEQNPGSVLHVLNEQAAHVQKLALKSRLGIPLILGIDAIHGHSFHKGATIFPTQLGLSCSWNPELIENVGRITAVELSYTGMHWTFSPVLCLARDGRWGRTGETFGEDPLLVGEFASALIKGYQGDGISDLRAVAACAKHYAGYSETRGGFDASEADLSLRKLNSFFLPPFERAAKEGCATFMTAYQAIDGTPCAANKHLMTEKLVDQWGFDGFVVTDWDCVGRMHEEQFVAQTMKEAVIQAVHAGNDMIMATPAFYQTAIDAVREGALSEALIDRAVRRILLTKFKMGLFEDPRFPDPSGAKTVIGCNDHREVALNSARESVVLLKNDNDYLPLSRNSVGKIAVIGPNADDILAQLGDWSLGSGQTQKGTHPRESVVTLLDGIEEYMGEQSVKYIKGCSLTEDDAPQTEQVLDAVNDSDLTVLVLGDHLKYIGELKSTATLELMGRQAELLETIMSTGKPVIIVLINSKPLVLPEAALRANAILTAFNPGMLGGRAIADILFGTVNPCGKLTISWPSHAGQLPLYYNNVPGQHGKDYADLSSDPLFPFGYGLSYSEFSYKAMTCSKEKFNSDDTVEVTVEVANESKCLGSEIVQLYVTDLFTSVTWPRKTLKRYRKITLNPNETKKVVFTLNSNDFALCDSQCRWVVEPGEFLIRVGSSSRDEDLLEKKIVFG
ncbi:glycoside hydrolase family 3 N-terminal domain-containing protein [Chitinispirillales bacterium ANBcel5]|uniref:glycoside hydrolase family 3 N-terminal domain-containing protein n=1 Tax=Cellulosispirillum alkaliphilum TaxID=3039283 RepID=UPI002A54A664|nr:glycoside hydrolase family 3 N-terminal domain-containing protein [Chitinispirillales bacterium ANBcel5]